MTKTKAEQRKTRNKARQKIYGNDRIQSLRFSLREGLFFWRIVL